MMTHPPERGRGRGGGRGRGRGRTNARPGWSDKGPSFDRGTDFREPSRFQHDAQQPARFWRKKVDLNADPNAFYDQIHRTGSADRQHSSRDGRTSQPSDWGRAGRNGPVFEPVDTAGRFVPDLDGSDAKSGGFIPDNSEVSLRLISRLCPSLEFCHLFSFLFVFLFVGNKHILETVS